MNHEPWEGLRGGRPKETGLRWLMGRALASPEDELRVQVPPVLKADSGDITVGFYGVALKISFRITVHHFGEDDAPCWLLLSWVIKQHCGGCSLVSDLTGF